MTPISSLEVGKCLPRLLERVQHGESFVITSDGAPIAQLIPIDSPPNHQSTAEIIAQIKACRQMRPGIAGRSSER